MPIRLFNSSQMDFDPEIDYYSKLNVKKNSSESEIKKEYYKLAQKYHPDKNPNDKKAADRFKEISNAWSVIGDSKKRQQYDAVRGERNRMGGGGRGPGNPFSNSQSQAYGDFYGFQNPHTGRDTGGQQRTKSQQYSRTVFRDKNGNEYVFYNQKDQNQQAQGDPYGQGDQHQYEQQRKQWEKQHGSKGNPYRKSFEEYVAEQRAKEQEYYQRMRQQQHDFFTYGDPNYSQRQQNPHQGAQGRQGFPNAGMNDPFNTPFENWYAQQKMNPFSAMSMFEKFFRFMIWYLTFVLIYKVFFAPRSKSKREMGEEEYLWQMQRERMREEQIYNNELERQWAQHHKQVTNNLPAGGRNPQTNYPPDGAQLRPPYPIVNNRQVEQQPPMASRQFQGPGSYYEDVKNQKPPASPMQNQSKIVFNPNANQPPYPQPPNNQS